ncbi:MAG: DUF2970 domain-containing protein [Halieaceae bacterium]|jgi:hypothetical protein
MNDNPQQQQKPPGLRALLQSVLAAALGVQSSKNRERDFTDGKASHFIVAGIVFTFLFIATVATIVNLVTIQ